MQPQNCDDSVSLSSVDSNFEQVDGSQVAETENEAVELWLKEKEAEVLDKHPITEQDRQKIRDELTGHWEMETPIYLATDSRVGFLNARRRSTDCSKIDDLIFDGADLIIDFPTADTLHTYYLLAGERYFEQTVELSEPRGKAEISFLSKEEGRLGVSTYYKEERVVLEKEEMEELKVLLPFSQREDRDSSELMRIVEEQLCIKTTRFGAVCHRSYFKKGHFEGKIEKLQKSREKVKLLEQFVGDFKELHCSSFSSTKNAPKLMSFEIENEHVIINQETISLQEHPDKVIFQKDHKGRDKLILATPDHPKTRILFMDSKDVMVLQAGDSSLVMYLRAEATPPFTEALCGEWMKNNRTGTMIELEFNYEGFKFKKHGQWKVFKYGRHEQNGKTMLNFLDHLGKRVSQVEIVGGVVKWERHFYIGRYEYLNISHGVCNSMSYKRLDSK